MRGFSCAHHFRSHPVEVIHIATPIFTGSEECSLSNWPEPKKGGAVGECLASLLHSSSWKLPNHGSHQSTDYLLALQELPAPAPHQALSVTAVSVFQ